MIGKNSLSKIKKGVPTTEKNPSLSIAHNVEIFDEPLFCESFLGREFLERKLRSN